MKFELSSARLSLVLVPAATFAVIALAAPKAAATPRPLPFTYTADTLPEGDMEVEEYVDMTPVKALTSDSGPYGETYLATQLQTEFEYGITDRLELGLYVAIVPSPGEEYQHYATLTEGTGFKERLRYRLADAGEWPVDVALYGEIVQYTNEFEIEAKIILERRIGNLRIAANAWAEREFGWAGGSENGWVLNPTAGATYQLTPGFHAGVEYWMRAEFPDNAPAQRPFSLGPHQFVGPALLFNFGKLWWSTGVYARVDAVNHSAALDDNYGPLWVRTVVGFGL
jgi:hypothetical protein